MQKALSILIPCYNTYCVELVRQLAEQCENIEGLHYEIIVADDGSCDEHIRMRNKEILELDYVIYLMRKENVGRARIRNFLAQQAQYPTLLFIDANMVVPRADYILNYMQLSDSTRVAYGGYLLAQGNESNLRYCYERAASAKNQLKERIKQPYRKLRTSNLFILREVVQQCPFDENLHQYGYEDMLLGVQLQKANIPIVHIENPVLFYRYESNAQFVRKTEESLRNLFLLRQRIGDFSQLLNTAKTMRAWHVDWIYLNYWSRKQQAWKAQLCSKAPNLNVFKNYKLGYLISLFAATDSNQPTNGCHTV